MALSKEKIAEVVRYCNRDLVPDIDFSPDEKYHNEWFISYFSFLQNQQVEEQLGDAFYQARFMYKLMNALNLSLAKQRGIVKIQIVQYASICEAVLDLAINRFLKRLQRMSSLLMNW